MEQPAESAAAMIARASARIDRLLVALKAGRVEVDVERGGRGCDGVEAEPVAELWIERSAII